LRKHPTDLSTLGVMCETARIAEARRFPIAGSYYDGHSYDAS
jgi:hypothetical protein